jgi:hypothetical protein
MIVLCGGEPSMLFTDWGLSSWMTFQPGRGLYVTNEARTLGIAKAGLQLNHRLDLDTHEDATWTTSRYKLRTSDLKLESASEDG